MIAAALIAAALTVTPIQHVVVIVQENRSVDNLLQFVPGLDTVPSGPDGHGGMISLAPVHLDAPWDIEHSHPSWLAGCDMSGGQCLMDGWNNEPCKVGTCPTNAPYAYVPQNEVQPYYTLCETYACADYMFASNQGPSFPAHQYLISGTSATGSNGPGCPPLCVGFPRASENPTSSQGGCDSSSGTTVALIDQYGTENLTAFPCFSRTSIFGLLDAASLPWRYYQNTTGAGLWHAPAAIQSLCPSTPCKNNPEYAANVISPSAQVLTDVANGTLAAVTFVTPSASASDHPSENNGSGPAWVASVVDAIGESPFWNTTAIFITWDDWGGWYDHEPPAIFNSYEEGFRVPFIAVSPYAQLGYKSTPHHEFGSILHYIEETFNLPSLGTTDVRADDLQDMFNYQQSPTPFVPIAGSDPARFKHDDRAVDD